MRVAITGATGNVGTALLRALADDDRITGVVGLARRLPAHSLPKVTWVETDVAVDDLEERFAGADAVVHLGAGGDTPPLAPDSPLQRVEELASGVGERA